MVLQELEEKRDFRSGDSIEVADDPAIEKQLDDYRHYRHDHELVDHAQALREITLVDDEWSQR